MANLDHILLDISRYCNGNLLTRMCIHRKTPMGMENAEQGAHLTRLISREFLTYKFKILPEHFDMN